MNNSVEDMTSDVSGAIARQTDANTGGTAHAGIPDRPVDQAMVRADHVRDITRLTPVAMAANMVNSALFAIGAWPVIPHGQLIAWTSTIWLLAIAMLLVWSRNRTIIKKRVSRRISRRAVIYAFVLALPWAWLLGAYLGAIPARYEMLIIAVSAGMACGGAFSLARIPAAAHTYAGTILVAVMAKCAMIGGPAYLALMAMTAMFGLSLFVMVRQNYGLSFARAAGLQAIEHQNQVIGLLLKDFEESASDWLWETDAEGRITYCSERFLAILGLTSNEACGKRFNAWACHDGENREEWRSLYRTVERRMAFRDRTVPVCIGEQRCWWGLTGKPVTDDKGRFLGYRGVGTDVTAEVTANELLLAKEEAERANNSKSRFLAVMSHELRTPLNAIIGFSELIAKESLGPAGNKQYVEYAGDINTASRDLLSIINDTLDIARVESCTITLEEDRFTPFKVIDPVVRISRPLAGDCRVDLTVAPQLAEATITGDRRLLKQILLNLVSNAIKFTPAGGSVTIGAMPEPEGGLRFTVRDTGAGVAENDIQRIFEPFTQIDDSLARQHGGVGLGLSIAQQLARAHGGGIEFESEVGLGSTASLVLPSERVACAPGTGNPGPVSTDPMPASAYAACSA